MRAQEFLVEGTDFTNAVNSIEKLVRQKSIEFASYEDLLKFVASRKFLQAQRNDQQFVNDVARSVLRRLQQTVMETSAKKVLQYVKRTHGNDFKIDHSILQYPNWELKSIPVKFLKLDTEEPDPYGRVNWIDPDRLSDTDINYIQKYPIVIDSQGWIIDGNHRATKARDLGISSLTAWVPAN